MRVNFTKKLPSQHKTLLENNLLQQVTETCLLGLIIDDHLSWQANTSSIVKTAYKRMTLLHKLYEFDIPTKDLVDI